METVKQTPPFRSEYPRPQFVRKQWMTLNGSWDFRFAGDPWQTIEVPFVFQSRMSGIDDNRMCDDVTYRRRFCLPADWQGPLGRVAAIVYEVFDNYVAGQCKEAVILGSLCFAGMTVLRLDYAGMVSVVVGVTALVPILGAYIGGAVGVLLLLFISPAKALLFLVFLVVLQQVEGNVIYPRVVGRKIGLPGMWVLLAITVGGGLWGIWGMLLGVPLATIFYQLLRQDVRSREARLPPGE